MTATTEKPFSRNHSRIIRVDGIAWDGPCQFEVHTVEWLSKRTGRYWTVWCARKVGRLGWDTGRTARVALAWAAGVEEGKRPRWLSTAVREAESRLG